MKNFIKNKLHEDLKYWHADDAKPEKDSFKLQSEGIFGDDKWGMLEDDVKSAIVPIIEKHKDNFGSDSYEVISAIEQVFENLFQRVNR